VECAGGGTVRVTTMTTGREPAEGHVVWLDYNEEWELVGHPPGHRWQLDATGTTMVDVRAQGHSLSLMPAEGCTASDHASLDVAVSFGDTIDVVFHISCAYMGAARVTTLNTGPGAPASSISLVLSDSIFWHVPSNGTTVRPLVIGDYSALLGVPWNCAATSPNPVQFTVADGLTSDVAFTFECAQFTGTIHVTTTTEGPSAPATHTLRWCAGGLPCIDDPGSLSEATYIDVPANGTVSLGEFVSGLWSVEPVRAGTCKPNLAGISAAVTVGATTTVAIRFSCP
jgi:hypothetical protein